MITNIETDATGSNIVSERRSVMFAASRRSQRILVGAVVLLATWVVVLVTPLKDMLALTGVLNDAVPAASAEHPVDPDKGYYLEELGGGAWFVSGWSHNTMFVVTSESVVVLDAPPSLGEAYLDAVAEVTDKPVSHLIYSHSHADHIGRADLFPDATVVAHERTAEILAERQDPKRRAPGVTFSDRHTLTVGGVRIELANYGPAHGPGNIAVYLPEQKVLSMIDIAFPKWIPVHEFAIAEDIDAYFQVYDHLLAYEFDHFIGGHANLGTYEDLEEQRDYVLDVRQAARTAVGEAPLDKIGQMQRWTPNPFVTANFGFERMTARCADIVEDKWEGRLAAVDVFTSSHCRRMVFYWFTD
ncbi:MAG: MBL fold metallo-hydrolase [Deltaproteobacteria bacterium]|nr:MBL fold metallo-hydrolase [Deltaproteobacteria bacterium]